MMAKAGELIEHPVTGERIIWRKTAQDTGGELVQMDFTLQPNGFIAGEHIHPLQEERFEIVSGSAKFRMKGVERTLHAGDSVTVPPRTPHVWWNDSDEETHLVIEFRPALRAEEFFETFFGLAQDGKVDKKTGLPTSLLLSALIAEEFKNEICAAQPPVVVQRVVFGVLGSLGRMRGYKPVYSYPRQS